MPGYDQQQNCAQHRHLVGRSRPDHMNVQHGPAWNPGLNRLSSLGNQAQQRRLHTQAMQAKLWVNQPGDRYEQQADRMAGQIMRMPDAAFNSETPKPATVPSIQREMSKDGKAAVDEAPPIVHDVLATPGHPLDTATRAFFEPRFGYDFGQVRVHIDAYAAESARAVHAHAYTANNDIVFGADQFAPGTREGQQLIAHELSHIVQPISRDLRQNTIQRRADISKIEPPIDCTKEITKDFSCFDLIGEMIRLRFDIRENDSWLSRYDSGEISFDQQVYELRKKHGAELRKKHDEKERVRTTCCPSHEVPGEPPTLMTPPVPHPKEQETPDEKKQ